MDGRLFEAGWKLHAKTEQGQDEEQGWREVGDGDEEDGGWYRKRVVGVGVPILIQKGFGVDAMPGWTSFAVCGRLRHMLKIKKV